MPLTITNNNIQHRTQLPPRRRFSTTVAIVCFAAALCAQAGTVRFSQTEDLAGCGLRVKLMPKSTAIPLPPPTTFTYSSSQSDDKQERYAPRELWLQDQRIGRWRSDDGHVLTLGKANSLLPATFATEHVSAKAIEAALRKPEPWTPEDLKGWMEQFLGTRVEELQRVKPHSFRFRHLMRVQTTGSGSDPLIAYAFTLNRKAAGQTRAPEGWFTVTLEPPADADREKARHALETSFLTAVTVAPNTSKPSSTGSPSSFQNSRYVSKKPQSPELEHSRAAAEQSVANMEDWWVVNTDHYVLLSNMGARYRTMIKQLQVHLESMRPAYAKLIQPQTEISAVSVVRVFANPEEYLAYVGPEHKWSGGMWMPMKKELVIRPIDWGKHRQQRERVLAVSSHEAFHQYLYYAMDQRPTSAWYNEGHAEFFEEAEVRSGRVTIEEGGKAKKDIEELVTSNAHLLPKFIRLSYEEFYAGADEKQRRTNYDMAWALVYYLRKGAPLEQDAPFVQILPKYAEAIGKRMSPDQATTAAFADVDMEALIESWSKFWQSRNRRSAARRNRILK